MHAQLRRFQQYRSSSGYWKSPKARLCAPILTGFNNIDPAVDTERWRIGMSNTTIDRVSTISIQQWILKALRTVMETLFTASFNNIDPAVDTERQLRRSTPTYLRLFQQYRSSSGYWKLSFAYFCASCRMVSTISIQQWILKVQSLPDHIQYNLSFNNIDPAVDTESETTRTQPWPWTRFNNIDPAVDTERSAWSSHNAAPGGVSTISIQQWILKVHLRDHLEELPFCFNNIDPAVDTERRIRGLVSSCCVPVSTISIQQWILKVWPACSDGLCPDRFNNIDPAVDTEREDWHFHTCAMLGFNNIDPAVDTESYYPGASARRLLPFQQYRSSSGYWKSVPSAPAARSDTYSFNNIDPAVDTESTATMLQMGT